MSLLDGIGSLRSSLELPEIAERRTNNDSTVKESASADTTSKKDAATLSTASGLLAKALDTSDVRSAKVDALRQSIAEGTYSVPSIEVAGKIVDALS
ncbi:MAG TPA: flagellar biosynthesis anti-sigma factor FlgM [Edaphobacter sp.]